MTGYGPDGPGTPATEAIADGPRTARAQDQPCQLYAHTSSPYPLRTQHHHSRPVYLQDRVYGQIVYGPDLWLCGLCHDAVHETIDWLLGEGRTPHPAPGRKTLAAAQATVDWYRAAQAEAPPQPPPSPEPFVPTTYFDWHTS